MFIFVHFLLHNIAQSMYNSWTSISEKGMVS